MPAYWQNHSKQIEIGFGAQYCQLDFFSFFRALQECFPVLFHFTWFMKKSTLHNFEIYIEQSFSTFLLAIKSCHDNLILATAEKRTTTGSTHTTHTHYSLTLTLTLAH